MTNMEKSVPDCDHQSLRNFISDSKWDEEGVISEIQRQVSELIGNPVSWFSSPRPLRIGVP